jgi:exonuclease III
LAFRLISLNLNGIRSATNKGFVEWATAAAPDCMGVQEVKAQAEDVTGRLDRLGALQGHFHYAQKKGYSGVGLYSRKAPSEVICGIGSKGRPSCHTRAPDGGLDASCTWHVILAVGGTNDGDAVYIYGAWVEYTRKILAA